MTAEEFRADLLASTASRAEAHETGIREAFVEEMLERLRDAGELPDAEPCAEAVAGHRGRRLEVDAFAFDDADSSLHLFAAIRDGGDEMPAPISLTDAREQGFNRLLGMFEQAREGWLTDNIEESRPLWALARRIQTGVRPSALRLSVLTDRPVSERLREIPLGATREGFPVTFQIWDVTRLKRIHEARSVRDDLFVDLSHLPGGGLPVLRAATGEGDYDAYLGVMPGEALADIFITHGSRLLEANVRTFLGRRGNINKGIVNTLAREPGRFFAYNNGLAATASSITTEGTGAATLLTGAADLQIVNGAQTTASLASLRRDGKLPAGSVFVPLKLSVVASSAAEELVPRISRYANTQNTVRASDFFANHAFHQSIEKISRRVLAPAVGGSLVQTHWFYERARGQHLNEQVGLKEAQKAQFVRLNPQRQVVTKTDMAKVESCFDMLPDVTCRGAEKAFTAFAERVTEDWKDEAKRTLYGDDWFRCAIGRLILFRRAEGLVKDASWYENGYRAQVVAYTCARLAALAAERSEGGRLDYARVWMAQAAGVVLERQMLAIGRVMMDVLRTPPLAGQNVTEWAKQQACRRAALAAPVEVDEEFDLLVMGRADAAAARREEREGTRAVDGLQAIQEVIGLGGAFWQEVRSFARQHRLLASTDEALLSVGCMVPRKVPSDWQAARLLMLRDRCGDNGFGKAP